ncbi:hypothetical protein RF11_05856 [Thelohanellus kitauei]|uniref:Uncharacterized protein n=1 Tax=Thelohanellus kitauei TaxID=669202 RepID=A0A0C2M9Z5_THEKT|nr:hypothetical protein RF11_05856 [Thelohanellus kitauei]
MAKPNAGLLPQAAPYHLRSFYESAQENRNPPPRRRSKKKHLMRRFHTNDYTLDEVLVERLVLSPSRAASTIKSSSHIKNKDSRRYGNEGIQLKKANVTN